jgi:hypothetical protein
MKHTWQLTRMYVKLDMCRLGSGKSRNLEMNSRENAYTPMECIQSRHLKTYQNRLIQYTVRRRDTEHMQTGRHVKQTQSSDQTIFVLPATQRQSTFSQSKIFKLDIFVTSETVRSQRRPARKWWPHFVPENLSDDSPVCMYVCIYVCMYVCAHICIWVELSGTLPQYVCMYVCMLHHLSMCAHTFCIMCLFLCICMYACMHVCTYTTNWECASRPSISCYAGSFLNCFLCTRV